MAVTIRSLHNPGSGTSPRVPTKPAGTAVDDLLLLYVVTAANVIPTVPEGFYPAAGVDVTAGDTIVTRVYQKLATATEPTLYYVYFPGGGIANVCLVAINSSTLAYPAIHAVATAKSDAASANKVWAEVNNTDANTLLLCFGGFSNAASTPHAGMTENQDVSGTDARLYLMSQAVVATGLTGTRTATGSSVARQRTITISITETATLPEVRPLPMMAYFSDADAVTLIGLQAQASMTVVVDDIDPDDGAQADSNRLVIAPPFNTARMVYTVEWTASRSRIGASSGVSFNFDADKHTFVGQTGADNFVAPAYGDTTSGTFDITLTYTFGAWPTNRDSIVSSPPTAVSDIGCRIWNQVIANAFGPGGQATGQIDITVTVTELEFDDGTIFTPASPSISASQMAVWVELYGEGLQASEFPVFVEIGAKGIYLTQYPLLIEFEYVEPAEIMPTYFPASQGTRRMHVMLPDDVGGYAFDPEYSWWSTIVAEESINQIINPSFERLSAVDIATEYAEGGTLLSLTYPTFSPVGATAGRRCARLSSSPGDSGWIEYDEGLAVTPGPYTFSCDVYVTRCPYDLVLLIVSTGGAEQLARRQFHVTSTGWQRLSVTYVEAGSGNRECRLVCINTNAEATLVYTDAWQFEAKAYPTTYLDGDMVGFHDFAPYQSYYWHGEPHHSMSTRRERTGSGGRVVAWSDEANFRTTSILGLGMATVEQKTQVLGDGREIHLSSGEKGRDFTITGRIFAHNPRHLINRHNDLIRLLRPNNTLGGDQMVLRFQEIDDNEQLIGAPLDIVCAYRDGLQGSITGLYQETLPLQFKAVQPFPMDTIESSAAIELYKTLFENEMVYRDSEGEYLNLGTEVNVGGVVVRMGFMRDGTIVALGNYTEIGGVTIDYAAKWNGTAWEALGTAAPSGPLDIDDGYKLGYPLTVGGVGGDVYEYDEVGDTWNTLGGHGFLGNINAIHRDTNGDIWVGGWFEFADDGTTEYNNVAKYDLATGDWVQLGGGLIDLYDTFETDLLQVTAVLATNDGSVYFAGAFGDALSDTDPSPGEVLAKGVVRWDIATSTWHKVGEGLYGVVTQMVRGQDGFIYATGTFESDTSIPVVQMRGFARYNGFIWEEVFPIVRVDGTYGADGMIQDEDGIFWFYNYVEDDPDDLFVVDGLGTVGFFGWRDGIFYPPDILNVGIRHMAFGPGNRKLYIVRHLDASDEIYVPALNYIDYAGSADAPLAVHVHGPGKFTQILNLNTRGGVYGRGDFTLSINEMMLLRTDTQRSMTYSNQRFNLQTQLSAGASNLKALRLRPGMNRISIFITDLDEDLSEGWLTWKNRFWALEEGRGN